MKRLVKTLKFLKIYLLVQVSVLLINSASAMSPTATLTVVNVT